MIILTRGFYSYFAEVDEAFSKTNPILVFCDRRLKLSTAKRLHKYLGEAIAYLEQPLKEK